jgi:hypothetical protein
LKKGVLDGLLAEMSVMVEKDGVVVEDSPVELLDDCIFEIESMIDDDDDGVGEKSFVDSVEEDMNDLEQEGDLVANVGVNALESDPPMEAGFDATVSCESKHFLDVADETKEVEVVSEQLSDRGVTEENQCVSVPLEIVNQCNEAERQREEAVVVVVHEGAVGVESPVLIVASESKPALQMLVHAPVVVDDVNVLGPSRSVAVIPSLPPKSVIRRSSVSGVVKVPPSPPPPPPKKNGEEVKKAINTGKILFLFGLMN